METVAETRNRQACLTVDIRLAEQRIQYAAQIERFWCDCCCDRRDRCSNACTLAFCTLAVKGLRDDQYTPCPSGSPEGQQEESHGTDSTTI